MFRTIDRVVLRVAQLKTAVSYYRDVLGMTVLREDAQLATLRAGNLENSPELVLHDDPDLPAEAVYFLVDDVRAMYQRRDELRLTFIHQPARVARGWRAAVRDPFGTVLHILDRTAESGEDVEDIRAGGTLFSGVEQQFAPKVDLLIKLYEKVGRTADDLPYTPHFESLYEPYANAYGEIQPDRAEVWRHLLNLRKSAKLPKLGEARSRPPELEPEDRKRLLEMLGEEIGRRDRLPYTDTFEQLVDRFNESLDRPISPHLVWRLVATLAK